MAQIPRNSTEIVPDLQVVALKVADDRTLRTIFLLPEKLAVLG